MRFRETSIADAWLVGVERLEDFRGFFARTWCEHEFEQKGPGRRIAMVQASISYNRRAGTLRGMHYAASPSREAKLVRCTAGAIHDVILDLRPDSPTFMQHQAFELSQANRDALFIPPGCAHGFQTLADDTEVLYQMTDFFEPSLARGVRWDDPAFGIRWPQAERTIHERDAGYPDFDTGITGELRGLRGPAAAA